MSMNTTASENVHPISVRIEYDFLYPQKTFLGKAVITDMFTMSDGRKMRLKDMGGDQIIAALVLASRIGDNLEKQGYKVTR